jgi:hypothetical protein
MRYEVMMNPHYDLHTLSIDSDMIDSHATVAPVRCISNPKSEADMDKKADKKLVSFRLSEDLLQALRERAHEDSVSVTELVSRLLKQGLQSTMDDRFAALEAEVKELRQFKQTHFGNLPPLTVYPSLVPQGLISSQPDSETKQRIANLEVEMKEGMARLEAMMEVLASRESGGLESKSS